MIATFETEPVLPAGKLYDRIGQEGYLPTARRLVLLSMFATLSVGCAAKRSTVVLSLQEINCQSCGMESANGLSDTAGVYVAAFDRTTAEVRVEFDSGQTSPESLVGVVEGMGFEVELGAGHGRYAKEATYPDVVDVVWISRGEAVELTDHMAENKVTVFDFYAEWCGPCREVDRMLVSVFHDNQDVAVRKIDIVDWDSEVAGQYLSEVPGLPYVIVYGSNGELIESISGLDNDALAAAIENGRAH